MKKLICLIAIASIPFAYSCKEKSAMEKLGDNIEETGEAAKEAAEETAEDAEEAGEKGEKKLKKLFK